MENTDVNLFAVFSCLSSEKLLFEGNPDPVHFRPDPAPDPANQNFKIGSYWHIKKQFKHKNFSHQTYFFLYWNDDYFYLKKCKNLPENV